MTQLFPILQCIPNFSEGRDPEKIQAIVNSITAVPGVFLLDVESDVAHHRCVVTFAGEPEAVLAAAFASVRKASELIDLNHHRGEHPRMGATDVLPLVPIQGLSDEECIAYARELGAKIGSELGIPVYLYEKAATRPERENLAEIRKGEYEGIKAEMGENPSRDPDFGPKIMGSAGATAVGVREPLIAFNVNLRSQKLDVAKQIAKKVRFSSGGLPFVKAMGFDLQDRGQVQVSMNLTNYKKTSVHVAFEAVQSAAQAHGVSVAESELVGLIPEEAVLDVVKHGLQLPHFQTSQILEHVLDQKRQESQHGHESHVQALDQTHAVTLEAFLDEVSSKSPTPGGGSVSALVGALAAALATMVANLTLGKKKYEAVQRDVERCKEKTELLRRELFQLIEEDAAAYRRVVCAFKADPQNEHECQMALKHAAEVPLKIAQKAHELLEPLEFLAAHGNRNASSDVGVAFHLVEAAVKGAILNVRINLKAIEDEGFVRRMEGEILLMEAYFMKEIKLDDSIVAL